MKKTPVFRSLILVITCVLLHSTGSYLSAQNAKSSVGSGKQKPSNDLKKFMPDKEDCSIDAPSGVLVVRIKGYNVCLGCLLAKDKKAFHQVDKYGHQPVLLVKNAICNKGTDLKNVEGWHLHYLLNDNSRGLFDKDAIGKPVILKGRFYIAERTLDVTAYRIVDEKTGDISTVSTDKKEYTVESSSDKPWYYERIQALKDSSQ